MLYQKELENRYSCDFVVCGGGFSGFAAAVSAARAGLKTMLVEKTGCLGGVGTNGGVNHLLGAKHVNEDYTLSKCISGLFDELEARLIASGDAIDPYTIDLRHNPHGWKKHLGEGLIFDAEAMKYTLEQMCGEAGVQLLYYTDIVDTVREGGRLTGIVAHNKSGLFTISGRYFADCTGDADLVAGCGCPVRLGREGDGLMAPASLELHVENVDTAQLTEYIESTGEIRFRKLISQLREQGVWDFPYDIFICAQLPKRDVYFVNTIRQVGVNGTDGQSLTDATVSGRAENFRLFEIMKKYFPGFANARIREIANVIGIRETRRIVGAYELTVQDMIDDKAFDDVIAYSGYIWDLPDPHRPSYQPMEERNVQKADFTPIPYRCMVPQGIENVIAPGRAISVERDVLGPLREMGPCIAMGQAAGIAASLAAQSGAAFISVDTAALRRLIREAGGIVSADQIVK